jgi:predicted nucleic acid-binding Zn finger protein
MLNRISKIKTQITNNFIIPYIFFCACSAYLINRGKIPSPHRRGLR